MIILQVPVDDRVITPGDRMFLQLFCKDPVRLVILADEERSGRIHIDPVHDPGTHDPVDAGQLIPAVIHNRIDKRMLIMSRRRMDNHSLRLIDHKDVIVFIKDIQRDIFRTDVRDFRFRNKDADLLTGGQLVISFDNAPVDTDISVFYKFLYIRTGKVLQTSA